MKHLKSLNKYLWKYRVRLFAGILFIIVSNYFTIMAPQITAYVVDRVQQQLPGGHIKQLAKQTDPLVNVFIEWTQTLTWSFSGIVALCGITILILAILRGVFMFLMRQTIIVMSRHIEFDLKNEVYGHYQQLDAHFYKTHSVGDLMNRISEDVSRVRMYVGPAIMYLVNLLTTIIFCVYNMIGKNLELTLYVLAPLPILAITIYYVNTIIHRKSEKIQALLSDLTTNAQQSYSGIRVIKSYVQEDAMINFFDKNNEEYRQNAIGLAKVEAIYFPSNILLIGISTLITIMMGALYYHQNLAAEAANLPLPHKDISAGTITEFILYITMLTFPFSAIGWVASMIQRASASQKRLNEFLQTKPEVQTIVDGRQATVEKPDYVGITDNPFEAPSSVVQNPLSAVQFRNISFTYPDTGIKAIKHLSLNIAHGQRIAVIGKTGSGKSTLAQLLLRMYDVNEGAILLGDKDIRSLSLKDLRQQVSYVPQDVFLFSETVENNIRFGHGSATRAEVVHAAEMAAVASEIDRFEKQYDTVVGERGVTLSGGQKQRISIARALLKPAPVIIFDDCLSAVDTRTEKEVLKQLDGFLKDKTAIIITHRIFSLMQFDQVIVLQDGAIAEQGTHEELLALNGEYAELYKLQQEGMNEPE
jgi:ATP-binding cassette subfamily B multidrug efflux pump